MNNHIWIIVRTWINEAILARSERTNLNRAGEHFYGKWSRADERYYTYIKVIAAFSDDWPDGVESVLDRLWAAISDIRYEDGWEAANYRFGRIMDEARAFAFNGALLLEAVDKALDAFGCPNGRELDEAAEEARWQEWLKQVEAREAAEAAQ